MEQCRKRQPKSVTGQDHKPTASAAQDADAVGEVVDDPIPETLDDVRARHDAEVAAVDGRPWSPDKVRQVVADAAALPGESGPIVKRQTILIAKSLDDAFLAMDGYDKASASVARHILTKDVLSLGAHKSGSTKEITQRQASALCVWLRGDGAFDFSPHVRAEVAALVKDRLDKKVNNHERKHKQGKYGNR